jgi:ABC-type lipoprotein export system ATPase subunit
MIAEQSATTVSSFHLTIRVSWFLILSIALVQSELVLLQSGLNEPANSHPGDLANQNVKGHVQQIGTDEVSQNQNSQISSLNALRAGNRAYFGWSDVSFKLSPKAVGKSKKDPMILRNQCGVAVPGEVVAIMGASGCGKTSLLNVLSGRIVSMNGHEVNGNFSINGISVKPENLGPKVAFVTQEDTLCPTATPREALDFSARLRLPPSVTPEERKRMVDEAIKVLRLEKCADSTIGDEMIKGISGGEKRWARISSAVIVFQSKIEGMTWVIRLQADEHRGGAHH